MQTNNFKDLLDKYLTGRLTEQERNRFYELLNDPEHTKQLAAFIDQELYEHQYESEPDITILAAIQENLHNRIQSESEKRAKVIRLTRRLAVASVLVIGFCGVAWWWLTSKKPTQKEIVQEKPVNDNNAITPGGNKATLMLSDGSVITLDSIKNGTLTKQGNAEIKKTNEGLIAYTPSTGVAPGEAVFNTIATPRGGQYQLVLADGTKVWLNASSSLRYPTAFTGKERRVELTGEGYFEVAHNKEMPFIVATPPRPGGAAGTDVEVLGTHFNVNTYEDEPEMKVTLLEGSVKVKAENSVILKPGEQAAVAGAHSPFTIDHSPDVEQVMAWKNGLFQFKAAGIETVLRQAARWYDVQFVFIGNIPERFSGQISKSANAEQLLKILELTGKVKFEINGKTITVKP